MAVALQAGAQLPEPPALELEELEELEELLEELEELDEPAPPESGPMNCQRLVVVGFQPVEL
jgi:hypothetical protein